MFPLSIVHAHAPNSVNSSDHGMRSSLDIMQEERSLDAENLAERESHKISARSAWSEINFYLCLITYIFDFY